MPWRRKVVSDRIEILIDADACPVKAEVYRVAARYGLAVQVVANAYIAVPQHPDIERVTVGAGFDAADDWIAQRARPGAIVVTSDLQLADRCLKAGAEVIGPDGRRMTSSSIGAALATRALMQDLRALGEVSGGGKPFSARQRSAFLSALDEAVNRLKRAGFGRGPQTI
jgi:uncharacterized protein YaiI (UPF0178 family)